MESLFQARFKAYEVFGLLDRANARQRRLFGCACVRRVWHLLAVESMRHAVIASEQYADGLASRKELRAAFRTATAAFKAASATEIPPPTYWALRGASLSARDDWGDSWPSSIAEDIREAVCLELAPHSRSGQREWDAIDAATLTAQMDVVKDLLEPAIPSSLPPQWPSTVAAVATALYAGEEGIEPLHDALLEAGQDQLARHFVTGIHPKGCWALDLLLGKE